MSCTSVIGLKRIDRDTDLGYGRSVRCQDECMQSKSPTRPVTIERFRDGSPALCLTAFRGTGR